jgi:CheY-like chemotaxis protein/HPt (histidine-containing phosphotransfer) domain-containing protein
LLLVEDNAINQQVAREILEGIGAEVITADSGEEALLIGESRGDAIDAVLMDLQMPGMDGYQTTQALRRIAGLERLPIIAMTADVMPSDRERCLNVGMDDFLAKPIDVARLVATLRRWMTAPQGMKQPEVSKMLRDDAALPLQLPGIDRQQALARFSGNALLLLRMLQQFADNHDGDVAVLRKAVNEADVEKARLLVHTLKGVAGILSAKPLHKAAIALEDCLKRPEAALNECDIDEFEAAFLELLQTARSLSEVESKKGGEAVDRKTIAPLLDELQDLLESYNLQAIDRVEQLREMLGATQGVDTLHSAISRLDYPAALGALRDLSETLDFSGAVKE